MQIHPRLLVLFITQSSEFVVVVVVVVVAVFHSRVHQTDLDPGWRGAPI